MAEDGFIPLTTEENLTDAEMAERAAGYRAQMQRRRSVRDFSTEPVPREVLEDCLLAAGSAPSGANRQPWQFVVVQDPEVKREIREAAEKEEHEFYNGRAGEDWLEALSPLGTDHRKQFLEDAPYLVVIFARSHQDSERNYYVRHSVGIATGMLISAIHNAGLACLPYTPSRMNFLAEMLQRDKNERPFLVLVVGRSAEGALVPDLPKKGLDDIATFI